MEIDLSCPHCSHDYQESNPPLLLSCGHTYCQSCLASLQQTKEDHSFLLCPEDQRITPIPDTIQQLPINLALMRLIDSRKKNSSNASNASMRDASFDMSKINKEQECQEDELAQQLISEINRATERKQNSSGEQPTKAEVRTQDTETCNSNTADKKQQGKVSKENKQKQEQDICLLHQRPIEVICMYDYERLCSKCALFGQHKSHEFRGVEEIESENQKSYQQVISVFQSKETLMEKTAVQRIESDLLQLLEVKANKLKRQVTEYFKKVAEELQKAEKKVIKKLEQMKKSIEQGIAESLRPDQKLISSYDRWELSTLDLIKQSQQLTSSGSIKFYLKREDLIKEGKKLVEGLKYSQEQTFTSTVQNIEDFTLDINEESCESYFDNLLSVVNKNSGKNEQKTEKRIMQKLKQNEATLANCWIEEIKKSPVTHQRHESEESLLDACEYEMHSLAGSEAGSRILDQSFVSVQADTHRQSQREHTARPLIKRKVPASTITSTLATKQKFLIKEAPTHMNVHNNTRKKAKALKVPEKYEKVIEGIINDSLQTVDLTNAELGDSTVLQIVEMMKDSKKVRTLKLIRNKITDDGVTKLIPYLGNLISLNLSQNVLTDHVLNLFMDNRAHLPQLKSLVLSQTKIVERKSKALIEKVKKTGLAVSV